MPFTQDQTVRLGQSVPSNNTAATVLTGVSLPEVAYEGMIVFRSDTKELLIYDGTEWLTLETGGVLTFVQNYPPTATQQGDIWYDSGNSMAQYVASAEGVNYISTDGINGWVEPSSGGTTSMHPPTVIDIQSSTPASPSDGEMIIYPKTDDHFYTQNRYGLEVEISGPTSERFAAWSTTTPIGAETAVTGWSADGQYVNDNVWDMVTYSSGTWTFQRSGLFLLTVQIPWQSLSQNGTYLMSRTQVSANGLTRYECFMSRVLSTSGATYVAESATAPIYATAGDTFRPLIYSNAASSTTIQMQMRLLRVF